MVPRHIVGIDEAGRGPLAGPVAVGLVVVPAQFDFSLLQNIRDSKQLSELGREIWYEKLRKLESEQRVRYVVRFASARMIDERGIVPAIRSAISSGLRMLGVEPERTSILLDGSLVAPKRFLTQQTIIRGDESEPVISLASIAAKVHRDRLMRKLALRYPQYNFHVHKGYGTPAHLGAIEKFGLCDIHRRTFCKFAKTSKI